MEDMNSIMGKVVCDAIEQHRALLAASGGQRHKYAVIVGRRLAVAAGMIKETRTLTEDRVYMACQTLAGMRVIINEYTASVEVVREG